MNTEQMNSLIESIRDKIAHNKPILTSISRLKKTDDYEELLRYVFENLTVDESNQTVVREAVARDLRKPSYLTVKEYIKYMTLKVVRLSDEDMKTENMKNRSYGKHESLMMLIDKNSTSALKGNQWKKVIKATLYLLKNEKVKFVFIDFIGGTDRMFRGVKGLSDILMFLEANKHRVLIKNFVNNLKDALNNATSLSKAHVSGKLKARIGGLSQSKKTKHTKETVIKEHKGGLSAIKTHANALLVPYEFLIVEHDINLKEILVPHSLNVELIEFLKSKITPEEILQKQLAEKDDLINRLLDKIDKLEKK